MPLDELGEYSYEASGFIRPSKGEEFPMEGLVLQAVERGMTRTDRGYSWLGFETKWGGTTPIAFMKLYANRRFGGCRSTEVLETITLGELPLTETEGEMLVYSEKIEELRNQLSKRTTLIFKNGVGYGTPHGLSEGLTYLISSKFTPTGRRNESLKNLRDKIKKDLELSPKEMIESGLMEVRGNDNERDFYKFGILGDGKSPLEVNIALRNNIYFARIRGFSYDDFCKQSPYEGFKPTHIESLLEKGDKAIREMDEALDKYGLRESSS